MNKDRKKLAGLLVAAIVAVILAVSILRKDPSVEIKYTRLMMGTVVEIILNGYSEQVIKDAADAGFAEIKRLESLMSHYQDSSDVSKINKGAGMEPVMVSPEVIEVVETSRRISEMSSGAFDITMGVLGSVWHFTKDDGGEPLPPASEEVTPLLKLVNFNQVIVDRDALTVKLAKEGMRINLGGVAKGYIVSKAVDIVKRKGIKKGIIQAGGDMFMFNETDDKPFRIGIRNPREENKVVGTIDITNGATATSGDYERFFIKDGVRYHHIIDPKTGFPAAKVQSVTIVAKDGTTADAVSTAVFVMGKEEGMKLIEKLPDAEGLIIDADGNITMSSGFNEYNPSIPKFGKSK